MDEGDVVTKEEFRKFVAETIRSDKARRSGEAADHIADQWESDVNDARIKGQDEATSAIESYSKF
jgi:hypothetical protein